MSRKIRPLLTALVGGLIGGLVLAASLGVFVAVATPEAIAINPSLFLFFGMTPSVAIVVAFILLCVYFGFATVWSFVKDFKNFLREDNRITFFYYAELFVAATFPLSTAFNTGLIANSILGGFGAVVSLLINVAFTVVLIEFFKRFAKNGGFTQIRKALHKRMHGSGPMRHGPQT